jgi:hypothetical protein
MVAHSSVGYIRRRFVSSLKELLNNSKSITIQKAQEGAENGCEFDIEVDIKKQYQNTLDGTTDVDIVLNF